MTKRILSQHFKKIRDKLIHFSNQFDVPKHSDIKGFGREAIINEFLSAHLPSSIEFITGEIFDQEDNRSGQVDIILQSSQFPKIPLIGKLQMAFSDSVIAAIEIKSDLNSTHLKNTLQQISKIKSLVRENEIKDTDARKPISKIPCFIICFKGPKMDTLLSSIEKYSKEQNIPLKLCAPDMVVNISAGFYICKNNGWIFPIDQPNYYLTSSDGEDEVLVGLYQYLYSLSQAYLRNPPRLILGNFFN